MHQKLREVLSLNLPCPDSITTGETVEITGDLTIGVPSVAGSLRILGVVARKQGYLESSSNNAWPTPQGQGGATGGAPAECTIETRFKARRDDRVSGAAVPVGPFVFGPNSTILPYTAGSQAVITGTTTGSHTFYAASATQNNLVTLSYDGGADQVFTIPAGVQTMAQVVTALAGTGFVASVVGGNLVLTGNDVNKQIEIKTVTGNAYTELGLTIGVAAAVVDAATVITGSTTGSHTFVAATVVQNNLISIAVAGGTPQPFIVAAGSKAMSDVATFLGATAVGFKATVNTAGNLVLSSISDLDTIAVVASSNNAYTALGLTVAVTSDIGSSYDPAAIMGLAITSCNASGAILQTLEY